MVIEFQIARQAPQLPVKHKPRRLGVLGKSSTGSGRPKHPNAGGESIDILQHEARAPAGAKVRTDFIEFAPKHFGHSSSEASLNEAYQSSDTSLNLIPVRPAALQASLKSRSHMTTDSSYTMRNKCAPPTASSLMTSSAPPLKEQKNPQRIAPRG